MLVDVLPVKGDPPVSVAAHWQGPPPPGLERLFRLPKVARRETDSDTAGGLSISLRGGGELQQVVTRKDPQIKVPLHRNGRDEVLVRVVDRHVAPAHGPACDSIQRKRLCTVEAAVASRSPSSPAVPEYSLMMIPREDVNVSRRPSPAVAV